jgi:hypothetical protein
MTQHELSHPIRDYDLVSHAGLAWITIRLQGVRLSFPVARATTEVADVQLVLKYKGTSGGNEP